MTLDAILIINGEETDSEAPGFLSRTRAALEEYRQNPTFIVTPSDSSRDYLLDHDVANEDLIEEQGEFPHFLIEMGADPKHYSRRTSCDAYTSLLFSIYATKDLLESETLGVATDANLAVPHTELAKLLATSEIIDIPSTYSVDNIQKETARMQFESIKEDMKQFNVKKEDFMRNRELLRRHPEIAQCYGETPRGHYANLLAMARSFK